MADQHKQAQVRRLTGSVILVLLLLISVLLAYGVSEEAKTTLALWKMQWGGLALALALSLYVALMAIPFLPGVEIGLSLLLVFGKAAAVYVYLGTVTGLSLAFGAGRLVSLSRLGHFLHYLHLQRAANFMLSLETVEPAALASLLLKHFPQGWLPLLLRHRYLALALLLNLPGNAILGGGGGIALVVGMSRMFPFVPFLATISLAVMPIPLLFYLDLIKLGWFEHMWT